MPLWLEGHKANKILIPLQSLVSLNPLGTKELLPSSSICCALLAIAQMGEGSSVFNLLCVKDQASENCAHWSGI